MIIGYGLIATAFHRYINREDIVIFASGVSDSKLNDAKAFERERKLLQEIQLRYPTRFFIYFSTTSVYDPELSENAYVKHKLEMENLVQTHKNYLVFRLSEVVGLGGNAKGLGEFLYRHIRDQQPFELWKNAGRRLCDIDDIVTYASEIIDEKRFENSTIVLSVEHYFYIKDIVRVFETLLDRKALYSSVSKGSCYDFPDEKGVQHCYISADDTYLRDIVAKYYGS